MRLPNLFDDSGPKLIGMDFDSECMPDAYLGGDLTTRRLTGIAWKFIGTKKMNVYLLHRYQVQKDGTILGTDRDFHIPMLEAFRAAYEKADFVTGHNIIRHDLPIINGAMVYYGLGPLPDKLASDTLLHGPKAGLTFSRSQENMGAILGIDADKYHMNNTLWKEANTLEPKHVKLTKERVTSDVEMHIQLRAAMIEQGILDPPVIWSASRAGQNKNQPH